MLESVPAWTLVAAGGGVGAASRQCLVTLGVERWDLPSWACIFAINTIGSTLAGIAMGLAPDDSAAMLLIVTGVLGALTTYSTWAVDTVLLSRSGRHHVAVLNGIGTLALTITGAWIGFSLAGGDIAELIGSSQIGGVR